MAGDEPDNKKIKPSADINSMTSKQYLDSMVVPHLLPALNAVSTSRPQDPIQYLVSPQNILDQPIQLSFIEGRLPDEEQEDWRFSRIEDWELDQHQFIYCIYFYWLLLMKSHLINDWYSRASIMPSKESKEKKEKKGKKGAKTDSTVDIAKVSDDVQFDFKLFNLT